MDRLIEQKKGLKKKHIPYILAGALFLFFTGWMIFGDHSSKMRVDAGSLIISSVESGFFNDYIRLNGQVQPKTTVVLSATEGGWVEHCPVNDGATVKRGDTLLVLRNPDLMKQVADLESRYRELINTNRDAEITLEKERLSIQQQRLAAKIEANRAMRTFEQQDALYADGLTTREEHLRARENHELARTQQQLLEKRLHQDSLYRNVQRAKMEHSMADMRRDLELAHTRVRNLNVCTTHDGQLCSFAVQIGQNIGAGSTIGNINIVGEYKIQVSIDERYIDRVVPGLAGSFERQGSEFDVFVSTVYPNVRDGLFLADLAFGGEAPRNIRVGQTYYINLELGEPVEALLLPRGSFFSDTGGKWVYVLSPDGSKAVRRNIKIGRQNPQFYEVIEGLEPGDRVITSGYDTFGDNECLIL